MLGMISSLIIYLWMQWFDVWSMVPSDMKSVVGAILIIIFFSEPVKVIVKRES